MSNFLWLFLSVISFVGVSACAPTATAPKVPMRSGPSVAAPVYKAGDSWVFRFKIPNRSGQGKITFKNGKLVADGASIWSSSWGVTLLHINPTFKPLDFPLTPGKTWSYKYERTSTRTGRTTSRDAQVTVIGPVSKPITTPAGQFKVIEIQRTETLGRAERKSTYFYSKESKSVVKMTAVTSGPRRGTRHYELELIKYSVR